MKLPSGVVMDAENVKPSVFLPVGVWKGIRPVKLHQRKVQWAVK